MARRGEQLRDPDARRSLDCSPGEQRAPGTRYDVRPSTANGQPACVIAPADSPDRPIGLEVLTIERRGIAAITVFLDEKLASRF